MLTSHRKDPGRVLYFRLDLKALRHSPLPLRRRRLPGNPEVDQDPWLHKHMELANLSLIGDDFDNEHLGIRLDDDKVDVADEVLDNLDDAGEETMNIRHCKDVHGHRSVDQCLTSTAFQLMRLQLTRQLTT